MEGLTFAGAVVGLTQFVKLVVNKYTGFKVENEITIVIAAVIGIILTQIDLSNSLVQAVYQAVSVVGGVTTGQLVASKVSGK